MKLLSIFPILALLSLGSIFSGNYKVCKNEEVVTASVINYNTNTTATHTTTNTVKSLQNTSQFTVVNCHISKSGYPVKDIAVTDSGETDIFPTQTIQVNVTQTGSYTIASNTVNGITFSKSGSFTQKGLQNVVLNAAGTPINYGTFTYKIESCEFERTTYIPDRRYKDVTLQGEDLNGNGGSTARHHRFLYRVFESDNTEEEWLQTNLGANYNKVGHPDFDPDTVPTSITDLNAFGSLYQWGRFSDGHELMNWVNQNGTDNIAVNDTTSVKSATNTPGHNDMIISQGNDGGWLETPDSALWQGENGTNNPCPCGFRVPLQSEFTTEADESNLLTLDNAFTSQFRVVGPSARNYTTGLVESQPGYQSVYWTSAIASINTSNDFHFQNTVYEHNTNRGFAFSVRCIMMSYKFERCDIGYDGQESFNLDEVAAKIIADYPGHNVSFHNSFENARLNNTNNLLTGSFTATADENPNIIFARLEDAKGNFVNGIKIKFYVYRMPEVKKTPTLFYCTTIGSNIGLFNLEEIESTIIKNGEDVNIITYYTSQSAAEAGESTGLITNYTSYSAPAGNVYARIENPHGCYIVISVPLAITKMTMTAKNIDLPAFCYTDEMVDLTSHLSEFTSQPQDYNVYYYDNKEDANANNTANAIVTPTSYKIPKNEDNHTIWLNFSLTGGINCGSVVSSFTLHINQLPQISTVTDYKICYNTIASLSVVTNGNTVNWYNAQDDIAPIYTGALFTTAPITENTTYWAEAISETGCASAKIPVNIIVMTPPQLSVSTPITICMGNSATIEVETDTSNIINWYADEQGETAVFTGNNYQTPNLNIPTDYWVEVVNQEGCVSPRVKAEILINETELPIFTLEQTYCLGSYPKALPLTSDNGIKGSWKPATINTSVVGIQTYTFTSNPEDCNDGTQTQLQIEITEPVSPEFNLETEYLIGDVPSVLPETSLNGINGTWNISGNENIKTYTFYPDETECATDSFEFDVIGLPLYFTPNADGVNDYWSVVSLINYKSISVRQVFIYDRYGKLLTSLSPNERWDGTYKGNVLPATDYWFKINYVKFQRNGDSSEKHFFGHFSLIR